MRGENGTPETPDWVPEPKPWSESRCCPTCESPQHAVWMHGERSWMNRPIASAEIDPLGSE